MRRCSMLAVMLLTISAAAVGCASPAKEVRTLTASDITRLEADAGPTGTEFTEGNEQTVAKVREGFDNSWNVDQTLPSECADAFLVTALVRNTEPGTGDQDIVVGLGSFTEPEATDGNLFASVRLFSDDRQVGEFLSAVRQIGTACADGFEVPSIGRNDPYFVGSVTVEPIDSSAPDGALRWIERGPGGSDDVFTAVIAPYSNVLVSVSEIRSGGTSWPDDEIDRLTQDVLRSME